MGIANFSQKLFRLDLRKKIFSALHQRFGGGLRLLISGGAAVDPEVIHFFRQIGIHCMQGYGLTESAPIIAVNRNEWFKDEAAGFPLPSVEVRVVDGEICARGPNVMIGYYRNPDATAEVIRDGWLHTGDLGFLDEDGFVHIRGRKKAVIVLTNGKNVYPEEVEYHLNKSPYILESLVWEGPEAVEGKVEEVQGVIVPDMDRFDAYSQEKGVTLSDEMVEEILREEVRRECRHLPHYKRVRKFTIRWEEFDKTTTRKIKRYLYTQKVRKT
jgi:long-chain acyl-CoA synthetase